MDKCTITKLITTNIVLVSGAQIMLNIISKDSILYNFDSVIWYLIVICLLEWFTLYYQKK